MMDFLEFETEVKSFFKYFNKKVNDEILNFWHRRFKFINVYNLRKGLNSFKFNNKFPDLSDVIERCTGYESSDKVQNFTSMPECLDCEDVGLICYTAIYHEKKYVFSARCLCGIGRKMDKDIPFINEANPEPPNIDHYKIKREKYLEKGYKKDE